MSDSNPIDVSPVPIVVSLAAVAYSEKNSLFVEAVTLAFAGEYYEKKKKTDFKNNNDLHCECNIILGSFVYILE